MYIVAGLGNPGDKYLYTRHNCGFLTIDYLCQEHNIKLTKVKYKSLYGEGIIGGKKVILVKPQTFMNNSGEAISELMSFYKISNENLIIIYDDTSLPVGKLRLRSKGSAGGHNGIKSIISHINSDIFNRIKIGIGAPLHSDFDLADYVLGSFSKQEQKEMFESFKNASAAVAEIINSGITSAMNKYN